MSINIPALQLCLPSDLPNYLLHCALYFGRHLLTDIESSSFDALEVQLPWDTAQASRQPNCLSHAQTVR